MNLNIIGKEQDEILYLCLIDLFFSFSYYVWFNKDFIIPQFVLL